MAVSMNGLDLSFMRESPLPPSPRKERVDFSNRATGISIPYFIGDIAPFVSVATRETVEITSRSQLRAYERANNIRQCGDLKGKVIPEQKARIAKETHVSNADKKAADFKWTD